jgi:hypothetical protein
LTVAASEQPEKTEFIEKHRAIFKGIIDKYSNELQSMIWLKTIPPEMTPRITAALADMTWRFLTFDQQPAFLTSDNPVFFFKGLGIGRPESEVTFLISSKLALWASWRSYLPEGYFPTNMQVVKEINRRTASPATPYVFHAKKNPGFYHS